MYAHSLLIRDIGNEKLQPVRSIHCLNVTKLYCLMGFFSFKRGDGRTVSQTAAGWRTEKVSRMFAYGIQCHSSKRSARLGHVLTSLVRTLRRCKTAPFA